MIAKPYEDYLNTYKISYLLDVSIYSKQNK